MIEMKTSNNKEIEIIISHHKYIRKVQFSLIIWLIIPSIVIVLIVTPFLLMFIAEIFILLTSIKICCCNRKANYKGGYINYPRYKQLWGYTVE